MMNLTQAAIFGVLQGATEFLPISSSGHLALAHHFLGAQEAELAFDVTLHLGTLLAILIYFRADFLDMAMALLGKNRNPQETGRLRLLLFMLVIATIPGALAGLLLGHLAEDSFRDPLLVAGALATAGGLLLAADRLGRRNRDFAEIGLRDALFIGLSQALAIVPGVSRSGSTISAGLALGLTRQAAVRFSFLLSAPIIFGAGVHELPKIIRAGLLTDQLSIYLTGLIASALSGYLVIAFLMRFIRTRSLAIFAWYRFALAGVVVLALLL
ncbi:MAG: undecaprenyl-diphosphatase UppP [Thermodesulfobacteriota bacterium]